MKKCAVCNDNSIPVHGKFVMMDTSGTVVVPARQGGSKANQMAHVNPTTADESHSDLFCCCRI